MLCGFLNPPRQMVTPSTQWPRSVSLMSWKRKPNLPEPALMKERERQDPNCMTIFKLPEPLYVLKDAWWSHSIPGILTSDCD